ALRPIAVGVVVSRRARAALEPAGRVRTEDEVIAIVRAVVALVDIGAGHPVPLVARGTIAALVASGRVGARDAGKAGIVVAFVDVGAGLAVPLVAGGAFAALVAPGQVRAVDAGEAGVGVTFVDVRAGLAIALVARRALPALVAAGGIGA